MQHSTQVITTALREHRQSPSPVCHPLDPSNRVINSLWIGSELSSLELLTLHSFTSQGHLFRLWTYGPLRSPIPAGVELRDANEIIPEHRVFRYRHTNRYGHGKGSVSGFSDIFRYKLLYEHGGWWVDMDITCLKPFDLKQPYFFRSHHVLPLVGNVMKAPPRSEVMRRSYEEAASTVDENNLDWHKPIEILNRHVFSLGLDGYIGSGLGNEDKWEHTRRLMRSPAQFPSHYLFIHWMNEEWRTRRVPKNRLRLRSELGRRMLQCGLLASPCSLSEQLLNEITFAVWVPARDFIKERWAVIRAYKNRLLGLMRELRGTETVHGLPGFAEPC